MAIIKEQLIKLLGNVDDNTDVTEILKGIEGVSEVKEVEVPFDAANLTIDDYKKVLETNAAIQGYNQSQTDSLISKAVESFKKGKMQDYIKDAVEAAKVPENETPEQKKLRELQAQIEAMQAKNEALEKEKAKDLMIKSKMSEFKNTYKDLKTNIPENIFGMFMGDTEEACNAGMEQLAKFVEGVITSDRESYYNGGNPQPPAAPTGGGQTPKFASIEEINEYVEANPDISDAEIKSLISSIE